MSKHLLFLAGAMLVMGAGSMAAQVPTAPTAYGNVTMSAMSSNGKYAAGDNLFTYGVDVMNLSTGEVTSYVDETEMEMVSLGLGRQAISNDGVAVISTTYAGTAAYAKDGEIFLLPVPDGIVISIANCITPDGAFIAGSIGTAMDENAKDIMQRPVVWARQDDGSYTMVDLPYPTKDITGRLPQYVLVDGISDDGKTLGAQLVDYTGMGFCQPMVYKLVDNEWQYTVYGNELLNPNGIEMPAFPGEKPQPEDFMTPEELAAYHAAQEAGENLEEPQATDFMTDEEKEAYQKAIEENGFAWAEEFMTEEEKAAYQAAQDEYWAKRYPSAADFMGEESYAAYQAALAKWEEVYPAYDDMLMEMMASSKANFEQNAFVLSRNGLYLVAGAYNDEGVMDAYVYNTLTGDYTVRALEGVDIYPVQMNDNGVLLSCVPPTMFNPIAVPYISSESMEVTLMTDYLQAEFPEVYTWVEENCKHTFVEFDWDTEEEIEVENIVLGQPSANADFSTLQFWTLNSWDMESDNFMYTYLLPLGAPASVSNITAPNSQKVEYFNLQGMRIDNPASGTIVIRRQGENVAKVVVK